jgi:SNF2 family DNA or RNA helicase
MLRRTKKSTLDGKPILQLPERIVYTDSVPFNPEETAFYTRIEKSAQHSIRDMIQRSQANTYTHALVLLLRLRQACCHIDLVKFSENMKSMSWVSCPLSNAVLTFQGTRVCRKVTGLCKDNVC